MLLRPFAVLAVAGLFASVSPPTYRILAIANAYLAKNLCSAIYVAGRDPEAAIAEENLVQIPLTSWRVDERTRSVAASYFGLATRRASFRPGRGCSLGRGGAPVRPRRLAESRAAAARRLEAAATAGDALETAQDEALERAIATAFTETDPAHPLRT